MQTQDLGRYSDAIMCLQQTLVEGTKSSNVDIDLMLANIHRCSVIVQELQDSENDDFFKTALSSLSGGLESHMNVLNNKIQNLSQSQEIDPSSLNATNMTVLTSCQSASQSTDSYEYEMTPPLNNKIGSVLKREDSGDTNGGEKGNKARQAIIESTILSDDHIRFDDVIGLKESKQSLYDAIIMPQKFPHLFSGGRRPWQRILLFGPPGTGKTRLAKALSTEIKSPFYCVSSTDLVSSWVGESEKLIKDLFHHARNQEGQSIVFIDEIDSLCRHRSSREDEGTRRIKTELLIQMDGTIQSTEPKILLLCATNCPWDLDTAFLRRFQKRIYIPLPDFESRLEMMKLHCKDNQVNLSDEDWTMLAAKTEGYSGSDLSTLTLGALLQPIRDLQTATLWEITPDGKWKPCEKASNKGIKAKISHIPPEKIKAREVNLQDFLSCMKSHPPTVSKCELQRFEQFTSSFGQFG